MEIKQITTFFDIAKMYLILNTIYYTNLFHSNLYLLVIYLFTKSFIRDYYLLVMSL